MKLEVYDEAGRLITADAGVGAGAAPVGGPYITVTPDATLTAEFALSTLATGLLKNNPGGNPSIAINADVPLMVGASAGAAGERGAVVKPVAGDNTKFLRGDASWQTITVGGGTGALVELVPRTTLGASVSSINLTGIAATFHALLLELNLRSDKATAPDEMLIRFNGDSTAANYYSLGDVLRVAAVGGVESLGATYGGFRVYNALPATNSPANVFSTLLFWIDNYSITGKPRLGRWGGYNPYADTTNNLHFLVGGGKWTNTAAAITQITVLPVTGPNFVAGGTYALFGLGTA